MAQLTHDRGTQYSLGDLLAVPVAAGQCIYSGALVASNDSGYAVPASDSSGLVFEGVAVERADNSDGADGDVNVIVRRRGRYLFDAQSPLDESARSAPAYAVDDQTVEADGSQVSNSVQVGVIDRIENPGECWISVDADVLNPRTWSEPTTTTT